MRIAVAHVIDFLLQILVWHTRTMPANVANEEKMGALGYEQSDLNVEV